ncbi:hypothetical protein DE146DRAFT_615919 [Phaeosphaeria sp. MPI-PUGE-AT-0046c]|nr:hypothetical protein DE146DRAFT_615919 [Phaeosphaeria sp. MPI-PUGE-AT-0046c]
MLRLFSAPAAVLGLLAIAHLPAAVAKPYPVHVEEFRDLHNASQIIDKRQCAGTLCGWAQQLCCPTGTQCYTDADNKAQCGGGGGSNGGGWQYVTKTYVETVGLVTKTSVYSTYLGGAVQTATCKASESPCGSSCCAQGLYCGIGNQCLVNGGGSTGGILPTGAPGTLAPSAPLRPTSSGLVIVTYTGRPTATLPFSTPIPTGAAGSPEPVEGGGGGLSGGAIAGIVIGVILGILLLLLLCLFCCARALFDTILAIFGFGKKKKHTHEETYIEEHHHSGGAAAAGGRWYGQGRPARPSRVGSEKKSGLKKGAGVAAALGGLALMLGLKRHQDKKHDDKSTTVSGSSYYYSDYTSSSSASSSDRRTRNTRHSSRR